MRAPSRARSRVPPAEAQLLADALAAGDETDLRTAAEAARAAHAARWLLLTDRVRAYQSLTA